MSTRIELPWSKPPLSNNDRGPTKGYRAKLVAQALEQARWAIRAANVKPVDGLVMVTTHWRIPNRGRRDADNLSATHKVAQDALRFEGVIPTDDWTVVRTTAQTIHPPNGEPAAMWLTVTPLEDQ